MQKTINQSRRQALKTGGGISLLGVLLTMGVVKPGDAWAQSWNKGVFEAKGFADALKALGSGAPEMSGNVQIIAPDIAENGAVVPVAGISKIAKTEQMVVLIEKNPSAVTAVFDLTPNSVPEVQTRVKMGQTSNVMVLVKADGKFYAAQKEVKVTVGGCGG